MGAIYFGGGTASVLSSQHVGALLSSFRELGQVRPETEITLEGSPRELTTSFLQDICSLGVNRVSLGYQSADQAVLDALNSPHRAIEGQKAVEACLGSPLRTFNVDLLFGVPGQTEDQCLNSLRILMDSGVPSIKIYKYVIHPSSPSQRLLDTGKLHLQADTETLHRWYMAARDKLLDAGYVEGRLGSFALPGHRQVYGHIAYDLGYDLLGFGAGAYSFSGGFQFANPWSPHDYIRRVDARDYPIADHVSVQMTKVHEMERFMIFGLMSGIVDAEAFQTRFGISPLSAFPLEFNQLCDARLIERDSSHIRLTEYGRAWKAHVLYHFYREHPPEADHEI